MGVTLLGYPLVDMLGVHEKKDKSRQGWMNMVPQLPLSLIFHKIIPRLHQVF